MYLKYGKRASDVLLSLIAATVFLPLFVVVAVLIKMTDPGPVIFRQERIGRDGIAFKFFKFRSMPVNTASLPSDEIHDLKISWVGKVIRRTNIDELPQLVNILKGDMSIVGPRPPLESQVELVELRKKNGALRCPPGLTGLAQVRSYDGMKVEDKAALDGEYASSVSLYLDLKIMISTVAYLFKPPPRY